MAIMLRSDAAAKSARAAMAKASGTDPAGFEAQLATTHLFGTPTDAYAFMTGEAVIKTMDLVRHFSFEHGILGQGASSPDVVGIQFPAGKSLGDSNNVKMRFDPIYTKMALDGQL
jgi:NitT/TauT family transport system substrate-binding protein